MHKKYLNIETVEGKEIIRSPNAVGALIYNTKSKNWIFIKQRRPAVGNEIFEICAGKIDEGETPEESIRREILEETGYKTDSLEKMIAYYPTVGYSSEIIHLYYAEVSEQIEDGGGIGTEDISVMYIDDIHFGGIIESSGGYTRRLLDGKSIMAINHKVHSILREAL